MEGFRRESHLCTVYAIIEASYSTALIQRHIRITLSLESTGLLEQSMFVILEKITRVANDTRSGSFYELQWLKDCNWSWPIMLQWCPYCHVIRLFD